MVNKKPKYIERMRAQDYIDATRQYLDYVEEHLNYVARAFDELSEACNGKEFWVGDDYCWHVYKEEVERHDLSKLSRHELVQYRDFFYPVKEDDKENSGFSDAWEHHKKNNHHHHETAEDAKDIVHMVIDWMAMSYKFGGSERDFYNKTKPKMNLKEEFHAYIEKLLGYLEEYRENNT